MEKKRTRRVAVLGGGLGSTTAVWQLLKATENSDIHYEITFYQMGWRLGGKGASGRNPDIAERIEEHGLHMWFGMYNNAFNQIKEMYDQLDRPVDQPLSNWKEAFTPENWLAAEEWYDNKWHQYDVKLPVNDAEPGGDHVALTLTEYLQDILSLIFSRVKATGFYTRHIHPGEVQITAPAGDEEFSVHSFFEHLETEIREKFHHINGEHSVESRFADSLERLRSAVLRESGDWKEHDQDTRCALILFDLAVTTVSGLIKDGVLFKGFDIINQYDLSEWLGKHGASEEALNSAFLRGAYNALFAYKHGDTEKPDLEAGTALRAAILAFSCRGSVMYKMNAGMGDVVFTPVYQLLKRSNVQFKFFHKVKSLELTPDRANIGRIVIGKQVRLNEGIQEYDPLVEVRGLPSWPSEPLYDQLNPEDAEALKKGNINLESSWADWEDREELVLEWHKDFDDVIFGLSLEPVGNTCKELMEANPRFKQMYENVGTAQTQAFQLWVDKDLKEMGWQSPAKVMGAYVQPLDTWSQMNQVLDRESWPEGYQPKSIHYFCGPMKDPEKIPPYTDHDFPRKMHQKVYEHSTNYLKHDAAFLFPDATDSGGVFKWRQLVDLEGRKGQKRLESQFFRANIDPSERYVLTVKDSSRYRLRTDETGFNNLYLAGDWIDNGFNLGCVESAVMGGMQCARALSGKDIYIVGEKLLREHTVRPPAPPHMYEKLKQRAREKVDAVKDDPQGRLELRKAFYEKYGRGFLKDGLGYGDAEIAFMQWEIDRGVLNPLSGTNPGSPWWYNVNLEFMYWSELGALVYESGYEFSGIDDEVRFWLDFIRKPSAHAWYRAHNCSIVSGYIQFADLSLKENVYERFFINEVLYRLMYAGCLEMKNSPFHSPLERFLDVIFNPYLGIMNIVEKIPAFYPMHYPMTKKDAENVVYEGHSLTDKLSALLNKGLILPHLDQIYKLSSEWLRQPGLTKYAHHNRSIYPNTDEKQMPKAWVKGKAQSLITLNQMQRDLVEELLPSELEPAPQHVTDREHHPVLIFYNHNRLHAAWLPWPKITYNEMAFLIPYVRFKDSSDVYAYTPLLYVDNRLVAWLGKYVWNFNKMYAGISVKPIEKGWRWFIEDPEVSFNVEQDSTTISSAGCRNAGPPDYFDRFDNLNIVREMLDLPGLMGRDGTFNTVNIAMDYPLAAVQPAEGEVKLQNLNGNGLPDLNLPFEPITKDRFGGFRINWDIALGKP